MNFFLLQYHYIVTALKILFATISLVFVYEHQKRIRN